MRPTSKLAAGDDSVEIKTRYPEGHNNNNPASVHYQLHVPQNARLDRINLVNGSLTVQKVSGEVNANLVNGKLRVDDLAGRADSVHRQWRNRGELRFLEQCSRDQTQVGQWLHRTGTAQLTECQVKASTVSGGIRTEFPLDVQGGYVGKNLTGTLGSGGTSIELSNVNGSIHIGRERGGL